MAESFGIISRFMTEYHEECFIQSTVVCYIQFITLSLQYVLLEPCCPKPGEFVLSILQCYCVSEGLLVTEM